MPGKTLKGTNAKKGLGLLHYGGKKLSFGKGAVAGDFVFLSGAGGANPKTAVYPKGIKAQTERALKHIKTRLEEAGASMDNTVKFTWYIADWSLEKEFLKARDAWFKKHCPVLLKERSYAGTLVSVGLGNKLVEIDCIAYVPRV